MPWLKDIENEFGLSFGYWEIEKIDLDLDKDEMQVSYRGYASQESKESGKSAVHGSFSLKASDVGSSLTDLISHAQAGALLQDQFIGATAV